MKIARMLAAASLVVASLGISTVASAQSYNGGGDRTHTQDRRDARDDRDRRDDRNARGTRNDRNDRYSSDRGRHYGRDRGHGRGWNQGHQRCRVVWRHHRKARICR